MNSRKEPSTSMDGRSNSRIAQHAPYSPTPQDQISVFEEGDGTVRRKGSFSFLRPAKPRERSLSTGSAPRRRLSKKNGGSVSRRPDEGMMGAPPLPPQAPRIPPVPTQPQLQSFGGEGLSSNSLSPASLANPSRSREGSVSSQYYRGMPVPPVPPVPPIPDESPTKLMPWERAGESITNRGRYSYASSAVSTVNGPRKMRRRKDPTPFNILLVGAPGVGKTSFIEFLESSLALPTTKQKTAPQDPFESPPAPSERAFPSYKATFVESEIYGERIGVTLWDSQSLEPRMADLQIKDLTNFVESKFEDTYVEESKVIRAPGFRDTHIHCVFLLLDPARLERTLAKTSTKSKPGNGVNPKANSFAHRRPDTSISCLDNDTDLSVMRALKGKTAVIPIIAKADTVTLAQMGFLRRNVGQSLKRHGLDSVEGIDTGVDSDADGSDDGRQQTPTAGVNGLDFQLDKKLDINDETDDRSMISHLNSESSSSSDSSFGNRGMHDSERTAQKSTPLTSNGTAATPDPMSPMSPLESSESMLTPFSIISADSYEPDRVGRKFPWGFADPYNHEHCSFVRLKESVFSEWRVDLRQTSREVCYERWRTSRLDRKLKRHAVNLAPQDLQTSVWPGHPQARAHAQPWNKARNHSVV